MKYKPGFSKKKCVWTGLARSVSFPCYRPATSRRFSFPPPDSLALLAAGGPRGPGELGESGIRWMVYISSLNRVHGVHLARLGLAFPSFSGIGHVGGVRFQWWSMGRRSTATVSSAGGLASVIFPSFSSSALMLESSVCFCGLSAAFSSMASLNPCPTTWLLFEGDPVILPVECLPVFCPS